MSAAVARDIAPLAPPLVLVASPPAAPSLTGPERRRRIGVLKWRYSEARQAMRLAFKRAHECVENIRAHREWLVKEEHALYREGHERNIRKNVHFIGVHRAEGHHHRRALEKIVRELEAAW